ncbi:MAG: DUF2088 domain-containing protein [Anaerolineae bacterium]
MNLLQQISSLDFPAPLPTTLHLIEQRFDAPRLPDIPAAAKEAVLQIKPLVDHANGSVIAVGVGSRGIANLAIIVRGVIDQLKALGARPFIFPAMGSHGGATDEGQRHVLAEFGVTEEAMGVEIRSSMAARQIGQLPDGPALFQDANAAQADYTLLINRVKPHTDFRHRIESGLSKMAVIGMGKQQGAAIMHAYGTYGFKNYLEPAMRLYEANSNLIGGIAIVENAYDQTARIVGLPVCDIGAEAEAALLTQAKAWMASLPFPEIDVLVVRHIGKNISGAGMDTNIIGRLLIPRQPEDFGGPDIAVIAALDVTPQSEGNASGIGLADVTTARLVSKMNWTTMYTNAITAGSFGIRRSKLPITLAQDRQALQVALRSCGIAPEEARIVFIQDTLTLDKLWINDPLLDLIDGKPNLSRIGETPLTFDAQGQMTSPWQFD